MNTDPRPAWPQSVEERLTGLGGDIRALRADLEQHRADSEVRHREVMERLARRVRLDWRVVGITAAVIVALAGGAVAVSYGDLSVAVGASASEGRP